MGGRVSGKIKYEEPDQKCKIWGNWGGDTIEMHYDLDFGGATGVYNYHWTMAYDDGKFRGEYTSDQGSHGNSRSMSSMWTSSPSRAENRTFLMICGAGRLACCLVANKLVYCYYDGFVGHPNMYNRMFWEGARHFVGIWLGWCHRYDIYCGDFCFDDGIVVFDANYNCD